MKRFLFPAVLFLIAACGDAGTGNNGDTSDLSDDSLSALNDKPLPNPESEILDTLPIADPHSLMSQDPAAVTDFMNSYAVNGWSIMDTAMGDLNRDNYRDMLIVLKHEYDTDVDSMKERPLIILTGTRDGIFALAERNDNVVFCYHCGGAYGDPYEDIVIKNGYFSVEHFGGSSTKWSEIITFKYNQEEKTWYLYRDAGSIYTPTDTGITEEGKVYRAEDYGKVKFHDYNYGE